MDMTNTHYITEQRGLEVRFGRYGWFFITRNIIPTTEEVNEIWKVWVSYWKERS